MQTNHKTRGGRVEKRPRRKSVTRERGKNDKLTDQKTNQPIPWKRGAV